MQYKHLRHYKKINKTKYKYEIYSLVKKRVRDILKKKGDCVTGCPSLISRS